MDNAGSHELLDPLFNSVLPPRVTLPWRKRPWKMRRRMLGLLTLSSSHPVKRAEKQEDHLERPKVEVSKMLV